MTFPLNLKKCMYSCIVSNIVSFCSVYVKFSHKSSNLQHLEFQMMLLGQNLAYQEKGLFILRALITALGTCICFQKLFAIFFGTWLVQSETLHKRIQRMFPPDSKMLLYFLAGFRKMILQDHLVLESWKNKGLNVNITGKPITFNQLSLAWQN